VDSLRRRLSAYAAASDAPVAEALEELTHALEELTVAEEELNVQGTELLLARMAAEAAEHRYRELFESAPDAYVITDRYTTVLEANLAAAALLGVRPPMLVGKPLAAYVALSDRRAFRRLVVGLEKGAPVRGWEGLVQPRHGPPVPVELVVDVAEVGGAAGWRWLFRDVTERRRLERDAVEAGDRERRRLGQEIHDDLGQRLVGLHLIADALRQDLEADGSPHAARAARIGELAGETLRGARALAHSLAAVSVPPEALAFALTELCETVQATTGVACVVEAEGAGMLKDAVVATHLFRIAQEAVTNAVRHGRPHRVTVRLELGPRSGLLAVVDDGCGFSAVGDEAGLGLRSMRLRAGYIHAAFDVRAAPGRGAAVECRFPVNGVAAN
jgi:two-component system sensor kinase FixL